MSVYAVVQTFICGPPNVVLYQEEGDAETVAKNLSFAKNSDGVYIKKFLTCDVVSTTTAERTRRNYVGQEPSRKGISYI
jgi:hypothetical protein